MSPKLHCITYALVSRSISDSSGSNKLPSYHFEKTIIWMFKCWSCTYKNTEFLAMFIDSSSTWDTIPASLFRPMYWRMRQGDNPKWWKGRKRSWPIWKFLTLKYSRVTEKNLRKISVKINDSQNEIFPCADSYMHQFDGLRMFKVGLTGRLYTIRGFFCVTFQQCHQHSDSPSYEIWKTSST
jgi:hypothetical protein